MKLNLRSIDLNLLTVFEAIWEERQLSRAAERLNMTQPAASQALGRLRTTFDDELFLRSRQGMKPTPRAEALAGPIRSALAQIQEAVTPRAAFAPAREEREFAVAFARFGELSLLPPLLSTLSQAGPGLSLRSAADDQTDVFELLRDNEIDFGFDYRQPEDKNLDCLLYEEEEMVVIARPDHPRIGDALRVADYFREGHVVLAVPDAQRVFYESVFSGGNRQRRIVAQAQQAVAIPPLVMASDALATIPRRTALASLFGDAIRVHPLPLDLPALPIYMCWHRAMARDAGHQWLKKQLLDCREQLD